MKLPKKIIKTPTPDDGTTPRRDLPDTSLPGRFPDSPATDGTPGIRRPEGESDHTPRQPHVEVADVSAADNAVSSSTGPSSDISFLPPFLVNGLSAPLADGLRHGNRRTVYAEIKDEGITLVRLGADGEYRAASINELNASGPRLERLAGTAFWRRKSAPEQAGPSRRKRPRLDSDSSDADALAADLRVGNPFPLDLSPALWRNWGSSTKPLTGESVEIDGLHYPIVPHGAPERTHIAYLKHPRFSPARYDEFEQMLRENPAQQPLWAIKRDSRWEVLERHLPFEKSLKAYVADSFRDLSDASLTAVARAVFNRANHSEVIDARGLSTMKQTYRHWANATHALLPRMELADPLLMLPTIPRGFNNGWTTLLPVESGGALRRLDFDPVHFPELWSTFVNDPSNLNLKQLVRAVLIRNGYEVFPLTDEHQGPTLVFTRPNHDSVFFLKLGRVNGEAIRQVTPSGAELSDPHLARRVGDAAQARLHSAYDQNKLVWLLGGTQITAAGFESVFLIRES
ncbi:hypothetical protein QIW53_09970 [Pseudomonas fluorescens]|uniref:hypothetical protein n=1 Tax=Pseudomonas fluorescens TaxID=294 RepID=UPI003524482C